MEIKYHDDIIPYLYEGVYVVNKQRQIIFWNEGSQRITGYSPKEVMGSFCYQNILQHVNESGKQLCFEGCPLHKTLDDGIVNEAHVFLKHKDGYRIPVMVKTLPIYDQEKNIVAAIEVFTDERFQKQIYDENIELKDKLSIDPLTKVANRHYFDFQISKKIDEAKVFKGVFGFLLIDIDHFKNINDTYGHLVGDEILKIVANSLSSNVGNQDIISRWGGEEFVGIINVDSIEELTKVAEKLRILVMKSKYELDKDTVISVTISIGGTLFQENDDAKKLVERADKNMYFSKQNGRNQCKII
jgi:diguanylate cyclase (GGDEF)-like protein/PAS domain S-box-containing protein